MPFQPATNFGTGYYPYWVSVGDFNGDGKPDLAVVNALDNTLSIFLNSSAPSGPAMITGPIPNSTLTGSSLTFQWTRSGSATAYWIDVGSTAGGNQYYQSGSLPTTTLSVTASGLPTDGSTVYVTLCSLIGGQWVHNDYTYTAFNVGGAKGVITIPTPGSMFTGSTVTFGWTAGTGATAYWLDVGSTAGGNQYYQSGNLGNVLTTTANGLPTDGSTLYVTLYSLVGGQWLSDVYTYTAFNLAGAKGVLTTPTPGSMFTGSTVTFGWTAGAGATAYWLDVGSTAGGNQYYQSGNLGNVLTTTVSGLPKDGSTVFVTLYSLIGGQWYHAGYTYTAFTTPLVPTFLAAVHYSAGTQPTSVATGDFNGDGNPDLAVADGNGNVSVLLGNGNGTFRNAVSYHTGGDSWWVAVGDFNGDAKVDLAVANRDADNVSELQGNGDGTFHAAVNYPVGTTAFSLVVGDVNGDGKPDLEVADPDNNTVSVLLGIGDGTFQAPENYSVGGRPLSMALGDFNGDHKSDLAVVNAIDNTVSVLLGNGDGTFLPAVNYTTGAYPVSVAVGDFNADSKSDLVVANYNDNTVSVLMGNGDGTFQLAASYGTGTHSFPSLVAVGDFNGDGKPDLAVANYGNNTLSILVDNGDGTFQAAVNYSAGTQPTSVAVGDFNGDGKPDLAVADLGGGVSILLNSTAY